MTFSWASMLIVSVQVVLVQLRFGLLLLVHYFVYAYKIWSK